MSWITRLKNTLLRRDGVGQEADDEMAFHLEERTRENITRGMTPAEARREAQMRFGSRSRIKEETREADTVAWLETLGRDARIAMRGITQRPGLAVTAILSLSLGIGATSAIFSVVDTVLLKPLPYPDAGNLVQIQESIRGEKLGGNPARRRDWQQQVTALTGIIGLYGEGVVLTGRGEPRRLTMQRSVGPFFTVLGVPPALGRPYREGEEQAVVLSHKAWQTHFGGNPNILGMSLNLSQAVFTVVGVMPPSFGDSTRADLFAAAPPDLDSPRRTGNWLDLVARLKPGQTIPSLNTQLTTVARRLSEQYPATESALTAYARPLLEATTTEASQPLWLLLATIGAVLLVVCANISSLLLVRANERQREFAVRSAMGAERFALVRLQLLESLWLGLIGGGIGVLVAYWGVELLKYLLPAGLPRVESVELDGRVALFAFGLALIAGLVCGLLAALGGASRSTANQLRDGARTTRRTWLRPAFVMLQVVLSTLLLAGAARFTESLIASVRIPLGFEPQGLIALSYSFPWDTPGKKLKATFDSSLERFAAIPGVTAVGFVDRLPLQGGTQSGHIEIPGRDLVPALRDVSVSHRAISDGYFAALGLPLQAGRMFLPATKDSVETVVNTAFAKLYFPGEDPIGRKFTFDRKRPAGKPIEWLTIVGVVADLRQNLRQTRQAPEAFVPYASTYWPQANFVLRTNGDPATIMAAARQQMLSVDPLMPIESLRPLTDDLREAASQTRTIAGLLGGFALTALLVAAIGLYGLLAGEVTAQRREIGIRLALGAEPSAVLTSVVRRGLVLVVAGLALGLGLSYPALRWLASQLTGTTDSPWNAALLTAALMLMVALVSSLLPARRASRVDPAIALRHE
ncbi:MAG: ABC transporter permease [Bryobacteraceae bacterium]|nr:ABC transporter permease [Bryobacteraceae bacterium]